MPIENIGWEFHIVRNSEQRRSSDGKRRTVGKYQVFHDGVKQTGPGLSGTIAETRGPGANKPAGNYRRIINDLRTYAGDTFPTRNGKRIPNAFVVIDGDP